MVSEKRESEIEIQNEGQDPGDGWFQRKESLVSDKRESGFKEKRVCDLDIE